MRIKKLNERTQLLWTENNDNNDYAVCFLRVYDTLLDERLSTSASIALALRLRRAVWLRPHQVNKEI